MRVVDLDEPTNNQCDGLLTQWGALELFISCEHHAKRFELEARCKQHCCRFVLNLLSIWSHPRDLVTFIKFKQDFSEELIIR